MTTKEPKATKSVRSLSFGLLARNQLSVAASIHGIATSAGVRWIGVSPARSPNKTFHLPGVTPATHGTRFRLPQASRCRCSAAKNRHAVRAKTSAWRTSAGSAIRPLPLRSRDHNHDTRNQRSSFRVFRVFRGWNLSSHQQEKSVSVLLL